MAQDPVTVNDIIVNAYYFLGEITPDTIPNDAEIERGRYLLNQMLDYFSGLGVYIANVKQFNVTLTPNKAIYTVSDEIPADFNFNSIVELDFVNILLTNGGSWPVRVIDRGNILSHYNYSQFQALPNVVYLDKFPRYSQLTFYPTPDLAYITEIRSKVMYDSLQLFEVITQLPRHYFWFMQISLAKKLSFYYPGRWDPDKEQELKDAKKELKAATTKNILTKPSNILSRPYGSVGGYGPYPWINGF